VDIGAHVSSSGGLVKALARGEEIGADCVQIFTQSPRMWRSPSHTPETLSTYRDAQRIHQKVRATFCHATYLINLAAADKELFEKSRSCLVDNLVAASAMGASGVVLHVGSHRGAGFDSIIAQVSRALESALDEAAARLADAGPLSSTGSDAIALCPLLLENAAGAGGTVGRSFSELGAIIEGCGGDPRLGMCLDTQHLFASGVDYSSVTAADDCIDEIDATIGLDRLGCIHLNDSKVSFGANRDRHENLGEGEIGLEALAALLGHPRLQQVPALLEVPGDGDGPRASDVSTARSVLAAGLAARA